MSQHKKTKKHKYNYLAKINKIIILPIDLQKIIVEYIPCFHQTTSRPFSRCVITDRTEQDIGCYWYHRKFFVELRNKSYNLMNEYHTELYQKLCEIEIRNIDFPAYATPYGYITTDAPMRDYCRGMNIRDLNRIVNKYVEHKYNCF